MSTHILFILKKLIKDHWVYKNHHILTLATANENKPYCSTCFYVYTPLDNKFIITSEKETKHYQ